MALDKRTACSFDVIENAKEDVTVYGEQMVISRGSYEKSYLIIRLLLSGCIYWAVITVISQFNLNYGTII